MKKLLLPLILLVIFVSPAFAAGNLTVNSTNVAPAVINKGVLTNMLNVTLNSTSGATNVTGINITIGGTLNISNITRISVINSTGFVFGTNTTNSSLTGFSIFFSSNISVNTTNNGSFVIALNVSLTSTTGTTVNVSIDSPSSFYVDAGSNVSFLTGYSNSSASQVRSHSNVTITPHIVDTSIVNQTFNYTFLPTGSLTLNNFSINLPENYTVTNVVAVYDNNVISSSYSNLTLPRQVNISLGYNTANTINVIFTANTSVLGQTDNFTSAVSGPALPWIATDPVSITILSTPILNVTGIMALKTVALANGTDYWTFKLTVNVTQVVSGLLQFRMNDWSRTDSGATNISLSSCITYTGNCAILSSTSDFTTGGLFNVTNNYNLNQGLNYTSAFGFYDIFLKMIVPSGTPISSNWYTTYYMAFRSS
ncbi:MAG: hypothetical protein NT120_04170 [Candidatus Aenigmarchaeota archaeon]|nr:hypothetical protein [Candidatus Aenigmarchaeota archaeon]